MKNELQETTMNTGLSDGSKANLWGDRGLCKKTIKSGGTAWDCSGDIYGNYNKWLQALVQLKGEKTDF